jgi:hypothetical protein
VAQVAAADAVQDQLQLMEQRMAEMEDRLQATSDELQTAKATVNEQRSVLSTNGLIEDEGLRSGVGSFFDMVDISGVAAASFNYRLHSANNNNNINGGNANAAQGQGLYPRYPNSNTFQVDQIWITLDKAATDESRAGFHAEFVTGTAAQALNAGNGAANDSTPYLYTGYVSYLAPVGDGVEVSLGRLATPLGAEVVQTNGNFNVTQGAVFALQPVTHTGVSFSTALTDGITLNAGVVNDVYSDTAVSNVNDKAYYAQLAYGGDAFGLNVGFIMGNDSGNNNVGSGSRSTTSVLDTVLTLNPTDNLSLWTNFDWVHTSGEGTGAAHGDLFGLAGAGRLALTDTMGLSSRVEYVRSENTLSANGQTGELVTLTGTLDKTLAEGLVTRLEVRWDTTLNNGGGFTPRVNGGAATNNDQVVALWQMYYEF